MATQAILVAAFWSSFIVVGAAALAYARRFRTLQTLIRFVLGMPLGAQVLAAFGAAQLVLAPLIVLGFAFGVPLKILSVLYGLMIIASLVYWWQHKSFLMTRLRGIRLTRSWLGLLLVLVVGVLAADYIGSLYIGAFIANGNDAYVHMAKIEQLVQGNMTLNDPYFSGVIESRYHLNFIHVLHAIGTQRLHMETIDFWMYSYPFFRVLCWLGIFTVAWYFSPIRNRRLFAGAATLVAVMMLVNFFASANYPNVMVLTWIGLFILGVCEFVRGRGGWLMLGSALLVSMTHPAYAVGVAGFMVLVAVYLALLERSWLTRRRMMALAGTLGLLLWPALIASIYPNRLSEQTFTFGTQIIDLGSSIVILKPVLPAIISWSALALLLSLVGYLAIIKSRTNRRERVVVGLLIAYFALIAYNPVVSLVAGEQLPPWMIERFHYINRLSVIAALAGIVVVVGVIAKQTGKAHRKQVYIGAAVLLSIPLIAASVTPWQTYKASRIENRHQYIFVGNSEMLESALHNQRVFALPGDSFQLPALTTMSVISMPDTNASPVANMAQRQACSDYLTKTLDQNALATAGVTRVMVGAWQPELMALAKQKPYLQPFTGNSDFAIFSFTAPAQHKHIGVCDIPHGQ